MDTSKRKAALLTGIFLWIMAAVAIFTFGFAHSSLVITNDATLTYQTLGKNLFLYRFEIIGGY